MQGSLRYRPERGAWQLRVHVGGGVYRSKTFKGTERQARTELARFVVEVDDGYHGKPAGNVGALVARWLDFSAGHSLPGTVHNNRLLVASHLAGDPIARVEIARLDAETIDGWYSRLAAKGLAPASIRKLHGILRSAFKEAVRWRLVRHNPVVDAAPPPVRRREMTPPAAARVAEVGDEMTDPEVRLFVRLAAATGARRGELCALQWRDLSGSDLTIARALARCPAGAAPRGALEVRRGWYVKATKSERARRVALDEETVRMLLVRRAVLGVDARRMEATIPPRGFVFSEDGLGVLPWRPDQASKRWRRESGGLARLHDLRHMHATELLDAGLPAGVVMERLGHSRESTTTDLYNHPVSARDRDAATVIAGRLRPG